MARELQGEKGLAGLADVSHLGQGAPKESRARGFYTSRLTYAIRC